MWSVSSGTDTKLVQIGNLIGEAAHRFLGVDPSTGRIIGAVAGNVIMNLGGKDNSLGNIGKVILDNIISGKFRRDVSSFIYSDESHHTCLRAFSDFFPLVLGLSPGPGPIADLTKSLLFFRRDSQTRYSA